MNSSGLQRILRDLNITWIFCVVITLILACPAFSQEHARISNTQREALVALFNSTHGESWKDKDGWLSDTGRIGDPGTECDWAGVQCDASKTHVVELSLSQHGLKGILPAAISNLRTLKNLNLSFNRLEGEIPKGLFGLRHLERLDLSQNRFRGSLPLRAPGLQHLESLFLSHNYLSGRISPVTRFRALVNLDLSGNRFEGSLPRSMGRLSKLESLNLQGNALTGTVPIEIGYLHSLRELSLAHNRITGKLPDQIGTLPTLQLLYLSYNNFTGPFPSLNKLKKLVNLFASHNAFDGSFPLSVCQDELVSLDFSVNQLDGELPFDMSACKSLQTLNLAHNGFHGEFGSGFVAAMTELESLDLSANRFSGPLPGPLDALTRLSTLNLSDNEFTGEISSVTWPELRILRMDRNHLSGSIPSQLLSDSLQELTLSANQLSGALPKDICASTSIRVLDLSHNHLTGSLCDSIGDLHDINVLNLSYNQLDGELPTSIGSLKNLTSLFLSNNAFAGPLPQEANLPALQLLDISSNQLTGDLPPWVGGLPILIAANFRNNAFTGGAAELVKLKTLRQVDLRENAWKDPLPQQVIKLQNTPASMETIRVIDPRILFVDKSVETSESETQLPSTPPQAPSVVLQTTPTPAQSEPTLIGTVVDPSGAAIADATVLAESASVKKTAETDVAGHYVMSLPVGEYSLTFDRPGFKKQVVEQVKVQPAASQTVNVALAVGQIMSLVEVAAEAPETQLGPWWNSWITRRGASEESKQTILQPNRQYSFYLELSGVSKRDQSNGDVSVELNRALRDRLAKLVTEGTLETSFLVRVSVIGRAAVLSDSINSVAEWSSSVGWVSSAGATTSAILNVELSRLLPNAPASGTLDSAAALLALRGGAVRFAIDTKLQGCAAIAVSIWDENLTIPLDHLVRMVTVGSQSTCAADVGDRQAAPTLYSESSQGIMPDVSLHVFEFTLGGRTHSASFMELSKSVMALIKSVPPCKSYSWDGAATITEQILNSTEFTDALDHARSTDHIYDDVYSSLGKRIAKTVFPPGRQGTCGSAAAFDALTALARQRDVRMFARVSDKKGSLAIVPLGLLAMFKQGNQYLFLHDIRLFEPIERETLSITECVSNWTFVLPGELEGLVDSTVLTPPPSLINDARLIRSREAFVNGFIDLDDSDRPTGLLLLAHHQDGILRFSGPADFLAFTEFKRQLGQGSIAVLSACETANLSGSTKFVTQLNDEGVDAFVAASFEVKLDFGVKFAFNFADIVASNVNQQITLEDAFTRALSTTVKDLSPILGDRARGMSLELVIAGNPRLKICTPNTPSHQ
jgi:Leucine-rich repeat (LRR) protein